VQRFNPIFLEEADEFLDELDVKIKTKILFNIGKAQQLNDPKLFKKLTTEIWEFRTKYENLQYRLFAFWDKRDRQDTLVICTHGMIKKTDKVPPKDIEKAERVRKYYFENQ
jgi:phage-related protein